MSTRKMPAAEYLTARGWFLAAEDNYISVEGQDCNNWTDHASGLVCDTTLALAVQRARDAAEERAAWVRFAGAQTWAQNSAAGPAARFTESEIAALIGNAADLMLDEYRRRFAVEIEP